MNTNQEKIQLIVEMWTQSMKDGYNNQTQHFINECLLNITFWRV